MLGKCPGGLDRLHWLLLALDHDPQERGHPPEAYEVGTLTGDRFPALHELQIEENLQWAREREARVREHRHRVQEYLRLHSQNRARHAPAHGFRQAVWCVELRCRFESLTDASEFVGRAASNISQAIRLGVRCGPYHWEHFDETRHTPSELQVNSG